MIQSFRQEITSIVYTRCRKMNRIILFKRMKKTLQSSSSKGFLFTLRE